MFDEKFNKIVSWQYYQCPVVSHGNFYKPLNGEEYKSILEAVMLENTPNSDDFTDFDGEIILAYNGEKFGYLDIDGNQLTDFCYDGGFCFAGREYTSVAKRNEHNEYKWGLIDKEGNLIIDYIYDSDITGGDDGIFSVYRDGKGFYININNETLLDGLTFDYAESFNPDGLAWVKKNNKWGIIDNNGREVCPCIFDVKTSFIDGIAIVSYKNKLLFITYKEPSEFGYTYDDVNKSINEIYKISDDPSFWNNFNKNFQDRISKNNWTEEDYMNDFSYTTTYKSVMPDAWYVTTAGVWYYFEKDRTTTKKGWFIDSRDNQTYYLDTNTGRMAVGWTEIDGDMYYFNESHANEPNWYEVGEGFYESYGKKIKAYGSMYKNEETPDGKKVDEDGKLIK